MIGWKMPFSNAKSLRFLSFSVLLITNMQFSRILAFRACGVVLGVYIDNLRDAKLVYECYF